ncbi:hypothetical protein [Desulfovibrio sp. JC010]|uniref:hypothetical protein n=1 Tax=Desulfovibrio sp. JC010 TaxID=2593641 RepID=UPI0013D853FB|nr:hypothetical protein [Desulfovibrio sp. JC010]NDV25176.1 hypothetical protein [Desulfovibrio sp. JC010]
MKKTILLITLLATLILCGCVARKIPGKHGFYSTKSPTLTVKFNGLEYQGEYKESKGKANVRTYFYADRDGTNGAWVEILDVRQGWNVRSKQVPGGKLPNTGIYTREIAGESYYCRTFLIPPGSGKSELASLPDYTAVRICTKLISTEQKISIGFAGQVNKEIAEKLFSSANYGELSQAQKDFFAAFDQRAETVLIMDKFEQGDVDEEIKSAEIIDKPWYRFTDFISLQRLIGKVQR